MAVFFPRVFGAVFPSLSSRDTLSFIARLYSVLVAAQFQVLRGVRRVTDVFLLRRVALCYAFVFSGTALVTYTSEYVSSAGPHSGIAMTTPLWASMAAAYLILALFPGNLHLFSYLHGAIAGLVGLAGVLFADELNQLAFTMSTDHTTDDAAVYATISQCYGILIIGMSLLTFTLSSHRNAAAPAKGFIQTAFLCMFSVSGLIMIFATVQGTTHYPFVEKFSSNPLATIVSIFTIAAFGGLALLYGVAE